MMARTDRHCRYFLRQISARTLLYSEMIHAQAVLRGDRDRLLAFDEAEHPVGLQLGGAEPDALARAAEVGQAFGYDEINLNIGCPSPRVRKGRFGAALMETPEVVADCARAMIGAVDVPVTVKCRIGIDGRGAYEDLKSFVETVAAAGVTSFAVHARIAVLDGLSPAENREIPAAPLRCRLPPEAGAVAASGGHQRQRRQPRRGGRTPRHGRRCHDRPRGLCRSRHAARGRPANLCRAGACPAQPARDRPFHAALCEPPVRGRRAAAPHHPAHARALRGPAWRARLAAGPSAAAAIASAQAPR